ncbi:MAG: methyltransferase domain-containing protein [Planctomycetota bacterium]
MSRSPEEVEDLKRRVAEITSWYHAIDLGDGVETPGTFRMADYDKDYDFPESLKGVRVLDVGAANGYHCSVFDRLGADEVVALEMPRWESQDWTPRNRRLYEEKSDEERKYIDDAVLDAGFDLVVEELGCKNVTRVRDVIYNLNPEEHGQFDIVFCGSMLMHVRDPVLGMHAMRSVCKPDGCILISVAMFESAKYGIPDDVPIARFAGEWDQCNWWQMSPAGLRQLLTACDFTRIEWENQFLLEDTQSRFEDPTYVVRARPRADD